MAEVYASLIKKGLKTIDDVPENLRADVEKILDDVIFLDRGCVVLESSVDEIWPVIPNAGLNRKYSFRKGGYDHGGCVCYLDHQG